MQCHFFSQYLLFRTSLQLAPPKMQEHKLRFDKNFEMFTRTTAKSSQLVTASLFSFEHLNRENFVQTGLLKFMSLRDVYLPTLSDVH